MRGKVVDLNAARAAKARKTPASRNNKRRKTPEEWRAIRYAWRFKKDGRPVILCAPDGELSHSMGWIKGEGYWCQESRRWKWADGQPITDICGEPLFYKPIGPDPTPDLVRRALGRKAA